MFKYIKTIHSHTVAETTKCRVDDYSDILKGTLCQFSDGVLVNSNEANLPRYLVLENKNYGDGKKYVDCIRILPGMMLIATADFETDSTSVGSLCSFNTDGDSICNCVCSDGTEAEIVAIDGQTLTIVVN